MTDLTPFEQRLSDRLAGELARSVAAFDAGQIARTAIANRSRPERLLNRLHVGPLPFSPAARSAALMVAVALLVLATVAVAALATRGTGGRLAFIRTNGDVVVASPDGASQTVIYRVLPPAYFTQLEWAPDGRHLAILDEDADLTIVTSTGDVASRRQLGLGTSRIEWSPDGQRLAVADGRYVAGEEAFCTPPLVHPLLDVIAPDGSRLETPSLPQAFRHHAGFGELAWSPDGRRIAIAGSDNECTNVTIPSSIWLVDLGQGAVRELTPGGPDQFDFSPTWLPDGRLLFSRSGTGLMQVDPATGATSVVLGTEACPRCENGLIRIDDLSPDGSRLALSHRSGLHPLVLDLTTDVVRELQPERQGIGGIAPLAWSPDGRAILMDFAPRFEDEPTVVMIDVASGAMHVVATNSRFFAVVD